LNDNGGPPGLRWAGITSIETHNGPIQCGAVPSEPYGFTRYLGQKPDSSFQNCICWKGVSMTGKDFNDYEYCDVEHTELRIFKALTIAVVSAILLTITAMYFAPPKQNTQVSQDKIASITEKL
jgi:hypothetical protein